MGSQPVGRLACVKCSFRSTRLSTFSGFFLLFSLFWILVGCLDWFRLCLVVVQWLRLCYAVLAHFDQLVFNVFQVASSSSSWFKLFVLWSVFVGSVSSKLSEFVSVCFTLFHVVLFCEELGLRSFVTLL